MGSADSQPNIGEKFHRVGRKKVFHYIPQSGDSKGARFVCFLEPLG